MSSFLRTVISVPFRVDTWRRVVYGLLALPVGLLCLVLVLVGRATTAASTQHWLARRLGLPGTTRSPRRGPAGGYSASACWLCR